MITHKRQEEEREDSPEREHPGSQSSQPRPRDVADVADTRPGGSPMQVIKCVCSWPRRELYQGCEENSQVAKDKTSLKRNDRHLDLSIHSLIINEPLNITQENLPSIFFISIQSWFSGKSPCWPRRWCGLLLPCRQAVSDHQRGHGGAWEEMRWAAHHLFWDSIYGQYWSPLTSEGMVLFGKGIEVLLFFDFDVLLFFFLRLIARLFLISLSWDRIFHRRKVDIRRSNMLQVTRLIQKVSRHGFEHIYASLGCFTESTWYL